MLFRLTKKAASAFKVVLPEDEIGTDQFDSSWYVNTFNVSRRPFIIVTESMTLMTVAFAKKGITNVDHLCAATINAVERICSRNGWLPALGIAIPFDFDTIYIGKTKHRSVLSSMTDRIQHIRFAIARNELLPDEILDQVNDVPMGFLGYRTTRDMLNAMSGNT